MFKLAYTIILTILLGYSQLATAGNSISTYKLEQDPQNLPLIGIRINGGAKYTNRSEIEIEVKSLKTDKSLIESMKVGFSEDLSDATWKPYTEEVIKMRIAGSDGEKRVFVQLKDKAGNESPIESNKIEFDTAPPENASIIINRGEKYTNDNLGRVLVNAKCEGAHYVMISNIDNFQNGRWQPYTENIKWVLDPSSGDGEKAVYAKFKDYAGNESKIAKSAIILDLTPPVSGSIQINDGAKYTNHKKFKLTLQCQDAAMVRIVSRGVGKNFQFSPDASGTMVIPWTTDSIQGLKSVKAYFMDLAKNTTKVPAEATIIYKTTPPEPAIVSIDLGQKYTRHVSGVVSIKLSARESPQNLRMIISNDPDFKDAKVRPFTASIPSWQLNNENDGFKSVYVRLIDQADNYSAAAKGEIFLDRTAPVINTFEINGKDSWSISLKVTLDCDVDDAYEAQFSNNPNTLRNIRWEKYNEQRTDWSILPGDGEKIVYARFRDEAGNVSEVVTANVLLDMTPPKGRLIVNGGDRVTNNSQGLVKLEIEHDEDVVGMQITNVPDFTEAKLLPLEKTIENWQVAGEEDGPKTIFLRLRDKAGNYSKIYSSGIVVDRVPPTRCDLVINNNDTYVRNKNKRVSLSLRAEGANFMMISNKQNMEGAEWIPFKTAYAWTLEGPEGTHYVHVKFKDHAGNESDIITKMVQSDFAPPKIIGFTINSEAEFCSDPQGQVSLTFNVEDAIEMAISNDHLNDTSAIRPLWEPYKPTKEWVLKGEDGLKIVYGRFKDKAGNITHEYYDKIILDRIPPTDGKMAINNGAEWLNTKDGSCDIQMYANGAHEVMISNYNNFKDAKWEPMADVKKDWKLDISKSNLEVFVKFRDKAGNESSVISSAIKLDLDPPKNASIIIDDGNKYVTSKDLKIKISLSVDGATGMRISQDKNFRDAKWEEISTSKEIVLSQIDGEKVFFAQFADDAGNMSEIVSSSIILDTTPPKVTSFKIDDGAGWTNHTEKKVTITVDAEGAEEMMMSDTPGFENASWQPFKPSILDFILPGDDGEKVLFIKLKDEIGNISRISSAKINLKRSF